MCVCVLARTRSLFICPYVALPLLPEGVGTGLSHFACCKYAAFCLRSAAEQAGACVKATPGFWKLVLFMKNTVILAHCFLKTNLLSQNVSWAASGLSSCYLPGQHSFVTMQFLFLHNGNSLPFPPPTPAFKTCWKKATICCSVFVFPLAHILFFLSAALTKKPN